MKYISVFLVVLLVGCNDQPLPAFVDSGERCKQVNCGEFQPDSSSAFIAQYQWSNSTQPLNQYPDSKYDQILGHHDYSTQGD